MEINYIIITGVSVLYESRAKYYPTGDLLDAEDSLILQMAGLKTSEEILYLDHGEIKRITY
jgi:hypothetical protein